MSSMSFIEQSQQTQRTQRTQSPTANILQAGSDCGCNSSSHSLIAQSQKVGCGCDEGGNQRKRVIEQQDQYSMARPDQDCWLVFSHMEDVEVEDTPLQDNPDYQIAVYKRVCYDRVGGGMDTGRGGGIGPSVNPPTDPIDPTDDTDEDPDDNKICLTCDLIKSLFVKFALEMAGDLVFYDGKEKAAYDALFSLMTTAMREILNRVFNGDGHPYNGIGHENGIHDGPNEEYLGEIYTNMQMDLDIGPGNVVPYENEDMNWYFLLMLQSLKECPDQMVFRLGFTSDNTAFSFDNVKLQKGLLEEPILTYPHLFVNESENGYTRTHFGSTISLGKNLNDPCRGGYSVYKWTISENGKGPSFWWRQKEDPDFK